MLKLLPALLLLFYYEANAQITTINGPAGSGKFGKTVTALPNGNYVVSDPLYDDGGLVDVGAVYLFNGKTHTLVSTLKGSSPNDSIGNAGIIVLDNGNFLVHSPGWDNASIQNAGAITWCSGSQGLSGIINSSNSLVGSSTGEQLGIQQIIKLTNGNYVIRDANWVNGSYTNAGAVVWGDASAPLIGTIDAGTALVGSIPGDGIGQDIFPLSNGNYVVASTNWSGASPSFKGAVTWCNGATGRTGVISSNNSLVGSHPGDRVGNGGIIELTNGNYVVKSPLWNSNSINPAEMGAVTWGSGNSGVVGVVSSSNSLTGTGPTLVGGPFITSLPNGNYVVVSPGWGKSGLTCAGAATWGNGLTGTSGEINSLNSLIGRNSVYPAQIWAVPLYNGNYVIAFPTWNNGIGAVTWANGASGITGLISSANSLTGNVAGDNVGFVAPLYNSDYVVSSPSWSSTLISRAGAVTWCNGSSGRAGTVNEANSMTGNYAFDQVGSAGIVPLHNNRYVICSPYWNNGLGAVTLVDGNTTLTGSINAANSLIGNHTNDHISMGGVVPLVNGNYVVSSPEWDNGSATDAGAVTWVNESGNGSGTISTDNSLVGTHTNDGVGTVLPLTNGNYVAVSPNWNNNAGAVTWGNGTGGVTGTVGANNSIVGSQSNDRVGFDNKIIQLRSGNYIVRSPYWSNGSLTYAGAVTWCSGTLGTAGILDSSNSLVGTHANDGVGYGVGYSISTFGNGNYAVRNMNWDNGTVMDAGAVTWGNGSTKLAGVVTECNSVEGGVTVSSEQDFLPFAFDSTYGFLIVGRPAENKISIYNPTGMALTLAIDSSVTNIQGQASVPLHSETGCRILATLTPNGIHPVEGSVKAKVWIDGDVITFNNTLYVGRRYEISPAEDAATSTAHITLYFTQDDFDAFNAHAGNTTLPINQHDNTGKARMQIIKYEDISSDGSGLPGSYSGNATFIDPLDDDIVWNAQQQRWEVSFDIKGFSGFFVGVAGNPLPLDLLSFNGRMVHNQTVLNWQTTGEAYTKSFDIERSKDGGRYFKIGNVVSANTPGVHQYSFIDADPASLGVPVIYYRLKQLDVDNSFRYSNVVSVSIDDNKNNIFLFPNPVVGKVNLFINTQELEHIKGRIIDNTGRVVKQYEWKVSPGNTTYQVDLTNLASGSYHLDLQGERTHTRFLFFKY